MIKKTVLQLINRLGYQVKKIPKNQDIVLYRQLYPQDSLTGRRFYNIGAGDFQHPFWTNVDYYNEWYKANNEKTAAGIQYDLLAREPLPIGDNQAEIVYSSHTVEHITDEAAQNMFNEAYRILKPGGILRITTPDIDIAYRAYINNDRHFFHWINMYSKPEVMKEMRIGTPLNQASLEQIFIYYFASSISTLHAFGAPRKVTDDEIKTVFRNAANYEEALNYFTTLCPLEIQRKYAGNHINWWSRDKMFRMLKIAGFSNIYQSAFGQSASPILRNTIYFDNTHPELSLHIESKK